MVTLKWALAPNADRYEVCYDSSNDNACEGWIDAGSGASLALYNLDYSTTYYWQVRALNGDYGLVYANNSESAYWKFTTVKMPIPKAPIMALPSNNAFIPSADVALAWNAVSYGETYHIQIASNYTFKSIVQQQEGISGLTFAADPLADGKYFWRVRAANANGVYGPWAAYRYFTVRTTSPN